MAVLRIRSTRGWRGMEEKAHGPHFQKTNSFLLQTAFVVFLPMAHALKFHVTMS